METKLSRLFDYQKFAPNDKLARMIAETEARYGVAEELSDAELEMVAAAGIIEVGCKRREIDIFGDGDEKKN